MVSVRALPAATRPGLLDALAALPFEYRWTVRWIGLDKADGEREISRLRKLIEPDPQNPRFIQTVWGVGYVFVPD